MQENELICDFDLRKGLSNDFINECFSKFECFWKSNNDIFKKYSLTLEGEVINIEELRKELFKILMNAFNKFKDKPYEKGREILTFSVSRKQYRNIDFIYGEFIFEVTNYQLSKATGTGYKRLVIEAYEKDVLDKRFEDNLYKFKLNAEERNIFNSIYSDVDCLRKNFIAISDIIIENVMLSLSDIEIHNIDEFKHLFKNVLNEYDYAPLLNRFNFIQAHNGFKIKLFSEYCFELEYNNYNYLKIS